MKRDKQEGPRYRGAFLLASVLHFYSGQPLQNLSGVDTHQHQARRAQVEQGAQARQEARAQARKARRDLIAARRFKPP